jgi:hypothetical protein
VIQGIGWVEGRVRLEFGFPFQDRRIENVDEVESMVALSGHDSFDYRHASDIAEQDMRL